MSLITQAAWSHWLCSRGNQAQAQLLHKPHPFVYNRQSILLPGLATFLLIALTTPLGFQGLGLPYRLLIALLFGTIVSLSIVLTVSSLRRVFPAYMQEERWTLGKELSLFLIVLSVISLAIFLLLNSLGLSDTPTVTLLWLVPFRTFSIGVFPIALLVLYEQYSHQKQRSAEALSLNQTLQESLGKPEVSSEKAVSDIIKLKAENGQAAFEIKASDLLYLKSAGNYVELFYYEEGSLKKQLLRNRLKACLAQLPDQDFIQTHKSYVVNIRRVSGVEGNARSLLLNLDETKDQVPVSRTKTAELNSFLGNLS